MKSLLSNDHAAFAMALGVVIATLIAILVGLMVYYRLAAPLYDSVPDGAPLGRAAINATNSTASTVFQLAPIIGIVMIAGIILAIVTRFGSGGV